MTKLCPCTGKAVPDSMKVLSRPKIAINVIYLANKVYLIIISMYIINTRTTGVYIHYAYWASISKFVSVVFLLRKFY